MDSDSDQPCKRRCTEKNKVPQNLSDSNRYDNGDLIKNQSTVDDGFQSNISDIGDNTESLLNTSDIRDNTDISGQTRNIPIDCESSESNRSGSNHGENCMNEPESLSLESEQDDSSVHNNIQQAVDNSRSNSGNDLHNATDILVDWVTSQNISSITMPSRPSEDQNIDNTPSCSYSSRSRPHKNHTVVDDTGEIIPVENLNSSSSDSDSSVNTTRTRSDEKQGSTFKIKPSHHTEMTLTFGGTGSKSNMTHTVLLGDGCNRRESVQYVFNFRSMSDSTTQTDPLTIEAASGTTPGGDKTNNAEDYSQIYMHVDQSVTSDLYQNINRLPSNILLHIFKSLTMYERLCVVSQVCKTWYNLCRDPDLWRSVNLSHQHKADDEVLSRLTSYSDRVTSINVEDTKLLTTYSISLVCVKCKYLQKLKLTRCFSVENDVLMMVGNSCRNLQYLYLDGCYRISDQWTCNVGEGCPQLKELVLSRCSQMTDVGIGRIAQHCHNLQNIILDHCNKVTDSSVRLLAENCPDLHTLSLANCNITDTGICSIYRMKKLEYLDISNLPGGSITAAVVSQLTRQCGTLECLNVSLNLTVDDKCIQEMMRYGQKLKRMFCVNCSISDEGLKGIAAHGRNIEKLDLGWCKDVTDKGIWAVTENCPSLKYLGLIRCDSVSEKGVEEMVDKYPQIQFSTFFMESRKLIQKAIANGFKFMAESEQNT